MRHTLFFDGVDLQDYHAYVFAQNSYNAPEREYEIIKIPARNGSLLVDLKRYSNIITSYVVIMTEDFNTDANNIKNFLASRSGYKRLEDTYHPDEFYLAYYAGETEVKTTNTLDAGKLLLNFSRKPQRFLKSGEYVETFESAGIIVNPEPTVSRPLIRVYGSGTVTVGNVSFTVATSENDYVDVDSEIEDAYCGSVNCNSLVTIFDFPKLSPGETTITPGTGITRLEVTPRWWKL